MSVESTLAAVGNDLKGFATKLAADWSKLKAAWALIASPQVRSVLIALGSDAIKTINASATAAAAGGVNVTLDSAVVADVKQMIADAKAGDGVIVADLKALGISI